MGRCLLAAALAALLGASSANAANLDAPVKTQDGLVQGTYDAAHGVHIFKAIPFAAPPVGDLRWRAPQPAKPWSGVLKADHFAPLCYQKAPEPRPSQGPESEDCLYLNIWTPAKAATEKRAVMVWIHGGGHNFGGAVLPLYDGTNLARKGVVLVTIPYRLGVMGFFAHPELTQEAPYHASGNYGALDQIAALKWIKANIAAFGGDPNNVTVFGEFAGAGAINILQASPLAKGLFARAIGESTSQMDSLAGIGGRRTLAQAEQQGVAFAKAMGADSLAALRAMPAKTLTEKSPMLWPIENDGYLLPGLVYDIFAQHRQNAVPVLVGANADEGGALKAHWIKPSTPEEKKAYAALWGKAPDPARVSDTDEVLWQMWSWATLNVENPAVKSQSYVYWFSQYPPHATAEGAGTHAVDGPVHAAEIIYVFDNLQARKLDWTEGDRRVADMMSQYWVNFAKTGNPNGDALPQWPAYKPDMPEVMNFDKGAKAIPLPHKPALRFIDSYLKARAGQ